MVESFFATLKTELASSFESELAAHREISDYVDFYNHTRLHSTLGYVSPAEYEAQTRNVARAA